MGDKRISNYSEIPFSIVLRKSNVVFLQSKMLMLEDSWRLSKALLEAWMLIFLSKYIHQEKMIETEFFNPIFPRSARQ